MLKQILRDMYVDPDILAELPEEQKEMLFFKIRQEQIRRYNEREKQNNFKPRDCSKTGKKLRILEDALGNPWTWIYGELDGEVTAEEKWKQLQDKNSETATKITSKPKGIGSTREKATPSKKITLERNPSRNAVLRRQKSNNGLSPSTPALPISPAVKRRELNKNGSSDLIQLSSSVPTNSTFYRKPESSEKTVLVKARNAPHSDHLHHSTNPQGRVATNGQQPVVKILRQESLKGSNSRKNGAIMKKRENADTQKHENKENQNDVSIYESVTMEAKQSDEIVSNQEWEQQLRQYKEADINRSIRARRASKEYRRQSLIAADPEKLRVRFKSLATDNPALSEEKPRPPIPPKPNASQIKAASSPYQDKPRNRNEIKKWFEETQLDTLRQSNNTFPVWFHGVISRAESEELLKSRTTGDFLIRVSDKVWGYVLSYKDEKIKHFLIDASQSQCYHFYGSDQIRHGSLEDLIAYHKMESISYNNETLKNYVGQKNSNKPDYEELEPKETDTRL